MILADNEHQERLRRYFHQRQQIDYYVNESDYFIGCEKNGEIIAAVKFNNYMPDGSIEVHLCFSGVCQRSFCRCIFNYCFNGLKVKKIIAKIQKDRPKVLKIALLCGLKYECTIKEMGFNRVDVDFYSMTREQCRFLP